MAESDAMKAKVIDIEVTRDDTRPLILAFTKTADGTPIADVTTWTFTLAVDSLEEPAKPTTTNLFTVNGVVTDGPNAKVSFTLSAGQAAQDPGEYYYEVQWENGAEKFTPLRGKWTVVHDRDQT